MRRGLSILSILFSILILFVVTFIILLVTNKALKEGLIKPEIIISPEDKFSAINIAKELAKDKELSNSFSWNKIEYTDKSFLEIRYMYLPKKDNYAFYVIIHPKESLAGVEYYSYKKSSTLVLGTYGDRLPSYPNGNFSEGQKILSAYGVIHELYLEANGYVNVNPPINEEEIVFPMLLVDNSNSIVEYFEYNKVK